MTIGELLTSRWGRIPPGCRLCASCGRVFRPPPRRGRPRTECSEPCRAAAVREKKRRYAQRHPERKRQALRTWRAHKARTDPAWADHQRAIKREAARRRRGAPAAARSHAP